VAVLAPGVDLLELGVQLGEGLDRKVDLVSLENPGVPLFEELIRDSVVLYEGTTGAAALWRSRVLADLEIDRPWYHRMRDAWLKRVAERGILD